MIKKTITFDDLDGNQHTKTYYFGLGPDDIADLEEKYEKHGGIGEYMIEAGREENRLKALAILRELMQRSFGVKSEDGLRHVKKPGMFEEFRETPAYEVLFAELATDADANAAFFNGIMPEHMLKKIQEAEAKGTVTNPAAVTFAAREALHGQVPFSDKELAEMPQEKFTELFGTDLAKMPDRVMPFAVRRGQLL